MSTSARARSLTVDADTLWVELDDGRTLGAPLAWFPRLLNATPAQRDAGRVGYGGTGLHWDEIDEDISVAGLLRGAGDVTGNPPPTDHAGPVRRSAWPTSPTEKGRGPT